MLKVCTLFSGSSANCTLIQNGSRAILIDAGGGVIKTNKALCSLGLDYSSIDAIFITHEHSDHVAGLQTILKKNRIPVIGNRSTLQKIACSYPDIDDSVFCEMPTGSIASKNDFEIRSFPSPHDSVECVGYRVTTTDGTIGVMTDAGEETHSVLQGLSGCKLLVLEANHDREMLMNGGYPYMLKKRIAGPCGHLSNEQSGNLLKKLVSSGTEKILLAHLSKENNTPMSALSTVAGCLEAAGIHTGTDVAVNISPRDCISEIYSI